MVLSGLLGDRSRSAKVKASRSSKSSSSSAAPPSATATQASTMIDDPVPTDYICDEAQLRDAPGEGPDLSDLNHGLEALAVVFPNIQIEVFREMLSSFDGESRLALVADALLKNRVTWVKGRWRVAEPEDGKETAPKNGDGRDSCLVPASETFRTGAYKDAVTALAWHEFKGLSRSTISAVLAESNYAYLDARNTLATLSSRSWRFAISSLFFRRKPVTSAEAQNHPLVIWKSTGKGSIIPTIKRTGNAELDRELYEALIRPLKEKTKQEQEAKDKELAQFLNNEEAAETDATHECCCCFTDGAFEEFTSCSVAGHLLCHKCVQHSLSEAVFGQGWHSVDESTGTLKCMAVDDEECTGRIPSDHLTRAILDMPKGGDLLHRFDQRLAEQNLVGAQFPLIHCPFCNYAEVDDIYLPHGSRSLVLRPRRVINLIFFFVCVTTLPLFIPIFIISTLACLILSIKNPPGPYLSAQWREALKRRYRKRRGSKFICRNPACGRASCLSCSKSWVDIHVCNESSLVSLRTQVEQAMSMAIKRVCPRCNTSFVKNAGCNKLRCPCGYKMCYICRKDIGEEGYRHFCDHFRPDGDPRRCSECTRCNLWESDDTEMLLKKAKEDAERKWMEREKRVLSGTERTFLETGFAASGADGGVERMFTRRRIPTLPEFLDTVLETMFY
ncbi:hypothetical protein jhhlp_003583 [Lomentospora prolificans]|uniref:RING-type domain-containing protein n=1 Tax=Lomentospora prolificans TaxID=41688 RepID=A0A2N3N959_9PEZI|nr:hypothetical protein jhhlp_003583 [Lomentospora prolificans]